MTDDWANSADLPSASDDGFGSTEYGFDDFDMGGVDGDKIGSGYLKVDRKGWYQLAIEATAKPLPYEENDMSKHRKPSISLKMTVQASDNGTPVGAIHYHDLILGGKGPGAKLNDYDRDQTCNFLVGCGVLKKVGKDVIDPETGTTKIKSSTLEKRLNGLVVIGKLEETASRPKTEKVDGRDVPVMDGNGKPIMYPARIEFPWGRGVFHPTAKEVAHHKWVNEDALKAAGIVRHHAPANV